MQLMALRQDAVLDLLHVLHLHLHLHLELKHGGTVLQLRSSKVITVAAARIRIVQGIELVKRDLARHGHGVGEHHRIKPRMLQLERIRVGLKSLDWRCWLAHVPAPLMIDLLDPRQVCTFFPQTEAGASHVSNGQDQVRTA